MTTQLQAAAQQRLRELVEKIERLEEDKTALGADISDAFLSAKAEGYDVKALRRILKMRKKSATELAEEDSIVDVYAQALGMRGTPMDAYFEGTATALETADALDKGAATTVSLNGGPHVPLDVVMSALDVMQTRPGVKYSGHNRDAIAKTRARKPAAVN